MDIIITTPFRAGLQKEAPTMKVWPKDDTIRKMMKHPIGGAFIPPPSTDPADWPNDTFTFRRMRDGDVLDHDPGQVAQQSSERPKQSASRKE